MSVHGVLAIRLVAAAAAVTALAAALPGSSSTGAGSTEYPTAVRSGGGDWPPFHGPTGVFRGRSPDGWIAAEPGKRAWGAALTEDEKNGAKAYILSPTKDSKLPGKRFIALVRIPKDWKKTEVTLCLHKGKIDVKAGELLTIQPAPKGGTHDKYVFSFKDVAPGKYRLQTYRTVDQVKTESGKAVEFLVTQTKSTATDPVFEFPDPDPTQIYEIVGDEQKYFVPFGNSGSDVTEVKLHDKPGQVQPLIGSFWWAELTGLDGYPGFGDYMMSAKTMSTMSSENPKVRISP